VLSTVIHKIGNRKGNRALREVFPLSRTHVSVRAQLMRTRPRKQLVHGFLTQPATNP
jgi:hypothetical protein